MNLDINYCHQPTPKSYALQKVIFILRSLMIDEFMSKSIKDTQYLGCFSIGNRTLVFSLA